MKEQLQLPTSKIRWPQGNKVEVGHDVDFVYIMRKDGKFAMSPIANEIAADYGMDNETVKQSLLEEYDTFFAKLADIFKWGYSSKGNFELHLFDPDELESAIRVKSTALPIVSLDPLLNQGVYEHKVSRGYFLGGKKDFGQVPRPDNESLSTQAQGIAESLDTSPASVVEDDIFSGESVIASLNELLSHGVNIQKVIPGIQVGNPKKLSKMELSVDPVVEYNTIDGADILNKVDLGDPRDYLLGASGLVLQLPDGEFGRAPYILPFVSTTARASIPADIEKDFAEKVLQANLEFFQNVQTKTGAPLLLKHMDHNFTVLMHQVHGVDSNAEMVQIVVWLMKNINSFWGTTIEQGEFQEKLVTLKLPQNIAFLDVNGTLFPDESMDGYIDQLDIDLFKDTMAKAKEKGVLVGICSDSPLPQLLEIAEKLGVDGPILAENGNLLYNAGHTLTLSTLSEIDEAKKQIGAVATSLGFQQTRDCVAPEFGGEPIGAKSSIWAFGANRETSITVFGPSKLISVLGTQFSSHNSSFSVDCSPEYHYFAIHPGENYKKNKGLALDTLSVYGHNIVMIGNSMSDWVEPEQGVICAFVGGARISSDVSQKAAYVSDKPVIKGVIDILEKM